MESRGGDDGGDNKEVAELCFEDDRWCANASCTSEARIYSGGK